MMMMMTMMMMMMMIIIIIIISSSSNSSSSKSIFFAFIFTVSCKLFYCHLRNHRSTWLHLPSCTSPTVRQLLPLNCLPWQLDFIKQQHMSLTVWQTSITETLSNNNAQTHIQCLITMPGRIRAIKAVQHWKLWNCERFPVNSETQLRLKQVMLLADFWRRAKQIMWWPTMATRA